MRLGWATWSVLRFAACWCVRCGVCVYVVLIDQCMTACQESGVSQSVLYMH